MSPSYSVVPNTFSTCKNRTNNAYSTNHQWKAVVHADPVFRSGHGFNHSSSEELHVANAVSREVFHQADRSAFENGKHFIGNSCHMETPMCGQGQPGHFSTQDSVHFEVPETPLALQPLQNANEAPRSSSIEEGDRPFSQELADMQEPSCSNDERISSDARITQEKLVVLQNSTSSAVHRDRSAVNASENVIEEYLSGIFMGEEADPSQGHGYAVQNDDSVSIPANQHVSGDTKDARSSAQRRAGLPAWDHLSAFAKVDIVVDNIDETLALLFLKEANAVLSNVCKEVPGANYDGRIRDSGDIDVFVPS